MNSSRVPARSLTPEDYARARRVLMRRDPVLAAVIREIGDCGLASRQHTDHLSALVGAIISQQLSGKAAATIFGRFRALFPMLAPARSVLHTGLANVGAILHPTIALLNAQRIRAGIEFPAGCRPARARMRGP